MSPMISFACGPKAAWNDSAEGQNMWHMPTYVSAAGQPPVHGVVQTRLAKARLDQGHVLVAVVPVIEAGSWGVRVDLSELVRQQTTENVLLDKAQEPPSPEKFPAEPQPDAVEQLDLARQFAVKAVRSVPDERQQFLDIAFAARPVGQRFYVFCITFWQWAQATQQRKYR